MAIVAVGVFVQGIVAQIELVVFQVVIALVEIVVNL